MVFSLTFGGMSRTLNLNIIVMAILAGGCWLAIRTIQQHSTEANERRYSERVNLALRQTAHGLLRLAGDSTSTIPPVRQTAYDTWLVRLGENFEYDSLPSALQGAFAEHRVEGDYNVAVLDCDTEDLMLGYIASQLMASKEIPCRGREQPAGCYNLRITFIDRPDMVSGGNNAWIFPSVLFFAILVSLTFLLFNFLKKRRLYSKEHQPDTEHSLQTSILKEPLNWNPALRFGRSILHIDNQKLVSNGHEKDLTYRETKLLQLFCHHTNQLLERDLILKSVWEDEGIIVGRSVDVFVSRLRKLLKDDATVKIVNVHGVGYRMEVRE